MDSWIEQQVRRAYERRLWAWLAVAVPVYAFTVRVVLRMPHYENEPLDWNASAAWLVLAAIFTLLLVRKLTRHFRKSRDLAWHRLIKCNSPQELAAFGEQARIDLQSKDCLKWMRWVVTPNYLVNRGWFHFDAYAWSGMLWVYRKETSARVHGVLIRGAEAVLTFDRGYACITCNDRFLNTVLARTKEHVPWALVGYNEDWQRRFQFDLTALREFVAQRKVAREAAPGAPTPALPTSAPAAVKPPTPAPVIRIGGLQNLANLGRADET